MGKIAKLLFLKLFAKGLTVINPRAFDTGLFTGWFSEVLKTEVTGVKVSQLSGKCPTELAVSVTEKGHSGLVTC